MDGGKILWSYAKPLLMGRILYSPVDDEIQNIITNVCIFFNVMSVKNIPIYYYFKANGTFSQIGKLFNLVHSFAGGFPSLESVIQHNQSLFTIQNLLSRKFIQDMFKDMFDEFQSLNNFETMDITPIIENLKNIKVSFNILY